MTVAEIQSRDDLPEELPGLFRSQPALLHQVIKQLPSWHMLQHQVPRDLKCSFWGDGKKNKRNKWQKTINLTSDVFKLLDTNNLRCWTLLYSKTKILRSTPVIFHVFTFSQSACLQQLFYNSVKALLGVFLLKIDQKLFRIIEGDEGKVRIRAMRAD